MSVAGLTLQRLREVDDPTVRHLVRCILHAQDDASSGGIAAFGNYAGPPAG